MLNGNNRKENNILNFRGTPKNQLSLRSQFEPKFIILDYSLGNKMHNQELKEEKQKKKWEQSCKICTFFYSSRNQQKTKTKEKGT